MAAKKTVKAKTPAESAKPTPKGKADEPRPGRRTKPAKTKPSALDAAAKVLAESGEAMNTKDMIQAMATKGYWSSPGGRTPSATLYSGILRELKTKGKEARFQKTERGKFALGKAS